MKCSPLCALVVIVLASPLLAQDLRTQHKQAAPQPRRSLAEGLVRQIIESERLTPPRLRSGLEMAAGQGPIALLVRKRDGTLTVRPLQRGAGDHGKAAKPSSGPIIEEEEVEEVVEAEKPAPGKHKRKPKPKGGAGRRAGPARQPARARPDGPAELRLRQDGEVLRVRTGDSEPVLGGSPPDRERLREILTKSFRATATGIARGVLILNADEDVKMQDLLSAWEIARAVGFRSVAFSGSSSRMTPEDRAALRASLERLEWKKTGILSEGELLILLDGQSLWRDVGPLLVESAGAGIWQLAFVGQLDRRTRFKIPAHLPVDTGR